MDHAETIKSNLHSPQNDIADGLGLPRGNSMEPTARSMTGGDDEAMDGYNDPAVAEKDALGSMDAGADVVEDGSEDTSVDNGLALPAAEAPPGTGAPLMSELASPTTDNGHGARMIQTMQPSAFGIAIERKNERESLFHFGPSSGPVRDSAAGGQATQMSEASKAQPSSGFLETLPPEVESSFDQAQDLSFDDEDSNDVVSDKASSFDADQYDPDIPLPQGQSHTNQANERTPLENAYGPFIHPTDASLEDSRDRLHVALEQTRLLRASFTEQAYERYRCVMKPVPDSLNEILAPIQSDPKQAGVMLGEQEHAIKVEKTVEKNQAQQAGVGLEELAYFCEGLHLVVLPEDEVDETEVDLTQFPHRGPTDPQTGERREEISAAAASTTEQVFDRIRRIRAFRMGADILPGAGIADAVTEIMTRNPTHDRQAVNESFFHDLATAPLASSPAPSVDSDASDVDQCSTTGALQHLLTLSPDSEGFRPDGSFTAVQSALVIRGVGMNEMRHDPRINPLRQRMIQPNYFSPTPSYKFLPPLLGPHQIHRLQGADARKECHEVRSGARESIKCVVEQICSAADKCKSLKGDDKEKDGSSVVVSNDGLRKALGEERGASEISLLRRMHSAMVENQKDKTTDRVSDMVAGKVNSSMKSPDNNSDTGDFDPLLAFSVMNAVGLVRQKDGNRVNRKDASDKHPEHAYARTLGIDSLMGLQTVSMFFHTIPSTVNCRKRPFPGADRPIDGAKRSKIDSDCIVNRDVKEDSVYQIRGGGGQDEANIVESKSLSKVSGEIKNAKKNGVSKTTKQVDAPMLDPALAACGRFDPLYNAMSQTPLGDKRSQSVIAAAASRQLLQHQLAAPPGPYHAAAYAHQLNVPIVPNLSSLSTSDLSDFLAGNPDWSALQTANPAIRTDVLAQHPQLTNSLGLLPGRLNLTFPDQEAARAMLLREHHNATTSRTPGAVTAAAAAHYQVAMSSINPQNPFGFVAPPLSRLQPSDIQLISSLPPLSTIQRKGTNSNKMQRKRSFSFSEKSSPKNINIATNDTDAGKPDQVADLKRPASAPLSPRNSELSTISPNGGLCTKMSSKRIVSRDEASTLEHSFALPSPPKGMPQEIADLIAQAKFHDAHSFSQEEYDGSESLLVKFLLSLGATVPIPKEFIADKLEKKLRSSNYQFRLHEFVGSSISASASRNVVIAIITVWLWAEHKDCFKPALDESGKKEANPSYNWLTNLAIDKSLSALATFFDSRPSLKSKGPTEGTTHQLIAAIASQSLAKQVFVDNSADASFPILEDLLKLLDSLRMDSLQTKTQERVLLAALTSRCGNMSEAFSNAYVSSIVRAGVALGHENVCEIGQDEDCRASTMLPYDFFHDNIGIWEEPCRPTTGYHPAVGGDELKKQAHARSVIQKSMLRLQNHLGLKGGISDGGPYFPLSSTNSSALQTPIVVPALVKTPSGSLNRRGSYESSGLSGSGPPDALFNPEHDVVPMLWNQNDVSDFPYGQHQPAESTMSEKKRRKVPSSKTGNPDDKATYLAFRYRSTHELEWEDVANMFFHGGSTRNIDINYDFGSNDHLGKKKICAPFVRNFDITTLKLKHEPEDEPSSDEDISDGTVLLRHQGVLDEMKLKLDTALENRKQPSHQRARKR